MKLYFFRHGEAMDRWIWKGEESLRPLTAEGEKEIEREARTLASLVSVGTILSSPYERAARTASILSRGLGVSGNPILDSRLAPGFDLGRLKEIAAEYEDSAELFLVGHEPDFSRLVGRLVGGAAVALKKGGLARVEWNRDEGSGTLEWLLPPKLLTQMSRG
ncbi:MAG: phosphohistidine phosphatase SixA [Rectinemataceae bacterium]